MLPAAGPRRLVGQVVVFLRQREQPASVAHIRCRRCEFDRFGCGRSTRTIHMMSSRIENDGNIYGLFGEILKEVRGVAVTKLLLGSHELGQPA
jgi:hypothetical protein